MAQVNAIPLIGIKYLSQRRRDASSRGGGVDYGWSGICCLRGEPKIGGAAVTQLQDQHVRVQLCKDFSKHNCRKGNHGEKCQFPVKPQTGI